MPEISSLLGTYSNYKDMAFPYTNIVVALVIIFMMTVTYCFYFARIHKQYKSTVDIMKLVNEFHPEPLCNPSKDNSNVMVMKRPFKHELNALVQDKVKIYTTVNQKKCLNLASTNFLNLLGNEEMEKRSIDVIRKYGVGSCGPRGFYGTVDVHLNLESRIAEFMNMEESIVYSYGFSTVASTIPAYCKSLDVIFCDSKISDAARSGLLASRSKCVYFEHNDAKDLENKLKSFLKNKKANPRQKRFLFLEGLYGATGTICNLPEMVKLRSKYQLRLFLDETNSLGVLGKTGRGVLEHFNVDPAEVDLIIGSLETTAGTIGGFCVGSHFTIEHQRLSGLGYCFSASLPSVLTDAAISAFNYMNENSSTLFTDLQTCNIQMHKMLENLSDFNVYGDTLSPIKFIEFKPKHNISLSHYENFAKECLENGLLVSLNPQSVSNDLKVNCSIKLNVNVALKAEDIAKAEKILCDSASKILNK